MIAARLAGGNLFFAFFVVEDFFGGGFWEHSEQLGAARSTRIFLVGDFWEHSEQLGALGFFLRGVVGCVLDCKCWKKLKND